MKNRQIHSTLFLDELLDENDENNKKFIESFLSNDLDRTEYNSICASLFGEEPEKRSDPSLFATKSGVPTFSMFTSSEPDAETKKAVYKPRLTRGTGIDREGYCQRCDKWFKLKTSSYWYHMNYKHGISASGRVCPDPVLRDRNYRVEGYCKECKSWIVLGSSPRNVRFGWFRHWQKMHCKNKSL